MLPFLLIKKRIKVLICRSNGSLHAGFLIKKVASASNGNGGGSETFAQGGSREVLDLDSLLAEVEQEIHG